MKTLAWNDLKHKSSPERLAEIDRDALAELDRTGFAALRKARRHTQVELAEKLGIDQASVSAIENRSDFLFSTLTKYVRALGGDIEIRAVFPEATFNLEPPPVQSTSDRTPARQHAAAPQKPVPARRTRATAARAV
jgi:transcriptional regulator with XRE-family HTH domain